MNKILRNLLSPRHTVYKLCFRLGVGVPVPAARFLSLGNAEKFSCGVSLKTYDGSGQAVHPSIADFRSQRYLALTPYPYGNEWYENPCVYRYQPETATYQPIPGLFPVILPQSMGAEHYSDPCLSADGGEMSLIFRKCVRNAGKKQDLLYRISTPDGAHWTEPVLFAAGEGDSLISPAVCSGRLWCVQETGQEETLLVSRPLDAGTSAAFSPASVSGLGDWFVWHIDLRRLPDGTEQGLFMLYRRGSNYSQSKLSLFQFDGNAWLYQKDIALPSEIVPSLRFVYKSAFIANEPRLLCSACDTRGRFFLFETCL